MMRSACRHLQRVQKALDQMNVQLHHAVTDITGLAILDAIVAGGRDPEVLAKLRHRRCKKSEAEIARSLRGDWREEHLFTLRQSLEAWRFHQRLMADCDEQIAGKLKLLEDQQDGPAPPSTKKGGKAPDETLRQQLFEKFGVDLTAVAGVHIQTVLAFLSEVGTDVSKFATAEHFASWLGLCPDNRITGGRTHAAHTRKVNNRPATEPPPARSLSHPPAVRSRPTSKANSSNNSRSPPEVRPPAAHPARSGKSPSPSRAHTSAAGARYLTSAGAPRATSVPWPRT